MTKLPQALISASVPDLERFDLRAPLLTLLRRDGGYVWLKVVGLVVLDVALLTCAWQIANAFGTPWKPWQVSEQPSSLVLVLLTTVGILAGRGLYGRRSRELFGLVQGLTFSHLLLLLVAYLTRPGVFISRSTFLIAWLASLGLVILGRALVQGALHFARLQGAARHPVFVIGNPEDSRRAIDLIERDNTYAVRGVLDPCSVTNKGTQEVLETILASGAREVFVCSEQALENPLYLYWSLRNAGLTLQILPLGLRTPAWRSEWRLLGNTPALRFAPPLIVGSDFRIKRLFDVIAASLLLLLFVPLFVVIALAIRLDSPGSVFFRQNRVGLHNRQFRIWKFRTMVVDADKLQVQLENRNQSKDGILFKIKDDPRITRVGHFLRRYSLDELPQLFNVLTGEMSLVGPRPLPMRDVERFAEHHFMRHAVLPGITGLWQVSGRSEIMDFDEVVRLDLTYIEEWSLTLDLEILLRTVRVVLQRTGAY